MKRKLITNTPHDHIRSKKRVSIKKLRQLHVKHFPTTSAKTTSGDAEDCFSSDNNTVVGDMLSLENSNNFNNFSSISFGFDNNIHIYESYDTTVNSEEIEKNMNSLECTLKQLKLDMFMKSTIGGRKTSKDAKAIITHFCNYISWTYITINRTSLPSDEDSIVQAITDILRNHHSLLSDYCEHYLQQGRSSTPSTVLHYLSSIMFVYKWFVSFNIGKNLGNINLASNNINSLPHTIRMIRKAFNKGNNQRRLTKRYQISSCIYIYGTQYLQSRNHFFVHRSLENLVFEGKYPQMGLSQLRPVVESKIEWANGLSRGDVDRGTYNIFMSVMFASLYTFSVNGRLGGIADAKFGQYEELISNGHAFTTMFKTAGSFGYQPIVVDYEIARNLLQIYVDVVRSSDIQQKASDAPLWLSFYGKGLTSQGIGNYVKQFFKRECQLNLNTTLLRGLMESHAEELYAKGEISKEARRSVSTINGHSEETAKRFYVRNNVGFDVCRSREIFQSSTKVVENHSNNDQPRIDNNIPLVNLDYDFGYFDDNANDLPFNSLQSSSECDINTSSATINANNGFMDSSTAPLSTSAPINSSYGDFDTSPVPLSTSAPINSSYGDFDTSPASLSTSVPINSSIGGVDTSPTIQSTPPPIRTATFNYTARATSIIAPILPAFAPSSHMSSRIVARYPTVATYVPRPLPVWSDLDWGTEHPSYGKKQKRAAWTQREIEYIGDFLIKHKNIINIAAACLDKIWHDSAAVPIFHINHIKDSARLRTGLDYFKSGRTCRKDATVCDYENHQSGL